MKHFFPLLLLLLLFSCHQEKADPEKVKQFAKTIHDNTSFEIKATQQEFVTTIAKYLKQLHSGGNVNEIDVKQLRALFERAKQSNQLSFTEIEKTKEVDPEINLRQKALAEIEMFRSLYENDFAKIVAILESKQYEKMDSAAAIFSEKTSQIKKIQNEAREADYQFTTKYNISFKHE